MPIVTLPTGRTFEVGSNETILQGALRANITLEYSCETGRCGTCKAGVLQGETLATASETGLTDEDRSASKILVCVRRAVSDVAIDMDDFGDIEIPARRLVPCRIDQIEALAPTVLKVVLRLPPASPFPYLDGQYVDVTEASSIRRSYSIANATRSDSKIELHIRKTENGRMSEYWFERAKVNDLLRLYGPLGTFFLRETAGRDLVFLATGTGMAPIKALLEGVARTPGTKAPRSVHVFWGGRTPDDFYWDPEEVGIAINYRPVLSRDNAAWSGARGYVQDAVIGSKIDLGNADTYACGSPEMIESARHTLVNAGLNPKSFFSDAFVSSEPVSS